MTLPRVAFCTSCARPSLPDERPPVACTPKQLGCFLLKVDGMGSPHWRQKCRLRWFLVDVPPHLLRFKFSSAQWAHFDNLLKMSAGSKEKEGGSTRRLWPFFLLHLSSGLSGSLTTLLIAHLTTLELGNHLEFYVMLTGVVKIPKDTNIQMPCCYLLFNR